MSFAITAELPLGTYRGAGPDGRSEPIPSVARLHGALLAAAGFGPRAVVQDGEPAPCEADVLALHWLEEHPPDSVVIPPVTVNRGNAIAYRDDGTIKQTRDKGTTKKFPKPAGTTVAVAGPVAWIWSESPPPPVRVVLEALCGDVPYLGTTGSPVRLAATDGHALPTHRRDRDAGMFTPGGHTIEASAVGRTDELRAAYARRIIAPRSEPRSGYRTDERSLSEVPPREAIEPLRYAPVEQPSDDVPWDRVIVVPLSRHIAVPERVAWAVATHKALIRLIGEGAPSLITGVYPPGVPRPANRLALHLLDPSMPVAGGLSAPATLAMLVPAGVDPSDLQTLAGAVDNLPSIRGPRGRLARITGPVQVVPGARFWQPPAVGLIRLWRTIPAAVPDTRGAGDGWTFAHAALLSLAFVWKKQLPPIPGRRERRERGLVAAATEAGAAVVSARPLRTVQVDRYAHRVNEHAVVRPYTACVWLGDLAGPTTVAAIGQSRHLGGGLLVPYDLPEGIDRRHLDAASDDGEVPPCQ